MLIFIIFLFGFSHAQVDVKGMLALLYWSEKLKLTILGITKHNSEFFIKALYTIFNVLLQKRLSNLAFFWCKVSLHCTACETSLRDQGARQGFPKIVQDVANRLFLNRWSRVPFGNNSICRMATTALETPYFPRRGAHALKKKNLETNALHHPPSRTK